VIKQLRLNLLLLVFVYILTGCAETLIISAVAPPTSTYTTVTEQKNLTLSNTSSKIQLLTLEDKRESEKLIRSITGFQGLLYHATGLSIDSERPINELITRKIGSHFENCGIMVVYGDGGDTAMHVLGGEIITFNLDKRGGFSGTWVANADLKIFLKNTTDNKVIEYYRVTGTAERSNWKGANSGNSGIDALNDALEIVINKLDMKSIQGILAKKQ
jgi:hypothetical protein